MDVFEQECTEFVQSQRGARFGAPGACLKEIRVCISRQKSNAAHKRANETLYVSSESRRCRRPAQRVYTIQVAPTTECGAVKLSTIVSM